MRSERSGGSEGSKEPEKDDDEAPEAPLDEPRPPRIEDPPPQPEPKHPYVVKHNEQSACGPREDSPVFARRSASERGGAPRA